MVKNLTNNCYNVQLIKLVKKKYYSCEFIELNVQHMPANGRIPYDIFSTSHFLYANTSTITRAI